MSTREELKALIIKELHLEDLSAEDLGDDTLLFGEEVGLDSLDAVELVVLVQKHFGVDIDDSEKGREILQTISTLANYIDQEKAS